MMDYTSIDTAALTYEDAIEDEAFNKRPEDYYEYVTIDASVIESIYNDFGIDEAGEALMYIAHYLVNSTNRTDNDEPVEPDYASMSTTAIKLTVRAVIAGHKKRMQGEYLRHYKQFVQVQAKKQAKSQQGHEQ